MNSSMELVMISFTGKGIDRSAATRSSRERRPGRPRIESTLMESRLPVSTMEDKEDDGDGENELRYCELDGPLVVQKQKH